MQPKVLAALSMEGGKYAAVEGLDPAISDWITRAVEAMAGDGDEPASVDPAMAKEPMVDPAKQDGATYREEDMPPKMRVAFRQMAQGNAIMLRETVRMRLHTTRTIDNIVLDAETERDLAACQTIEQFEREFKLVTRSRMAATETQRARSKVVSEGSNVNGAPPIDSLVQEGMSTALAKSIHASFAVDAETGNLALENARKRLPAKGGVK